MQATAKVIDARARPHSPAEYFPAFDWLRGVLASMVMLYHDDLMPWEHSGNFAVQVFFALSGWLIGGILLRSTRADLPRFYFNRSIRIWVPYYIAAVALIGLSVTRDSMTGEWWRAVAYKLTFVYNLFGVPRLAEHGLEMPLEATGNHFWSVNAEEQFYLIAPLCLLFVAARLSKRVPLWTAMAGLSLVALFTIDYSAILFGVTAAAAAHQYPGWHLRRNAQMACAAVAVITTAMLAAGVDYEHTVPFLGISIVLLLARPGKQSQIGTVVGGMSYPLYLNHWMGVYIGNALLGPFDQKDTPLRQAFGVVISLAIAVAHYFVIDRRLQRNRSAWYTHRRGVIACATGYVIVGCGLIIGFATL